MTRWLGLLLLAAWPASAATLDVTVTNVRSAAGHVLIAVCDQSTFLQPTCRYHARAPAAAGSVTVRLDDVPPGVYAAQAYQDENDNGKLDRNFLGIPTEGMGFSNDAPMKFGPPAFPAAAFTLRASGGQITFVLRYFN